MGLRSQSSQAPGIQVSYWPFTDGKHGGLAESQVWATCPKAPSFRGRGERGWGRSGGEEGRIGPRAQWGVEEGKLPLGFAHPASWEGLWIVSNKRGPMAGLGTNIMQ